MDLNQVLRQNIEFPAAAKAEIWGLLAAGLCLGDSYRSMSGDPLELERSLVLESSLSYGQIDRYNNMNALLDHMRFGVTLIKGVCITGRDMTKKRISNPELDIGPGTI
ncbi:hypothetical protein TWF192_010120, partial [Orbilia oligospora]